MSVVPLPKFAIMVACTPMGGIGCNGTLPWNVPQDLHHFRSVTTRTFDPKKTNAVIMGRKTWDSLPNKPLVKRRNIVLSRTQHVSTSVADVHPTLDDALKTLQSADDIESIFVIGGAQVFAEALKHPSCAYAYVTTIGHPFECDAFFPKDAFLSSEWRVMRTSKVLKTQDGIPYVFSEYAKRCT